MFAFAETVTVTSSIWAPSSGYYGLLITSSKIFLYMIPFIHCKRSFCLDLEMYIARFFSDVTWFQSATTPESALSFNIALKLLILTLLSWSVVLRSNLSIVDMLHSLHLEKGDTFCGTGQITLKLSWKNSYGADNFSRLFYSGQNFLAPSKKTKRNLPLYNWNPIFFAGK